MRALVTGGAGFIGGHIVDALLAGGHDVALLDSLDPRVHDHASPHVSAGARLLRADILDGDALSRALDGVDVVFHEAAMVGLGRGEADESAFLRVNVEGTRGLVRAMGVRPPAPRLVLASSMAVYGEGAYQCDACGAAREGVRDSVDLERRDWEARCVVCRAPLRPVAVREDHAWRPGTAYARSKALQEESALRLAAENGLVAVALRYHNAYGPRMPRNTPYAGVASFFKSHLLQGRPPLVHEDGGQLRDFVHVEDVVRANLLAAQAPAESVAAQAFNVGSGRPVAIFELAQALVDELAPGLGVERPGTFRPGDARHVFGSIEKARRVLGYEPRVRWEDGFRRFAREPMRAPVAEVPRP